MIAHKVIRVSMPCLALALALALGPSASAISIRDDVPASSYETQLNTSPYSASGSFNVNLTGTLLTPEWVLTAAHVTNPSTFTASDGTTRSVVERVVYPGDATLADQFDAGDGSDFALIRLSSPITTVPTATPQTDSTPKNTSAGPISVAARCPSAGTRSRSLGMETEDESEDASVVAMRQ